MLKKKFMIIGLSGLMFLGVVSSSYSAFNFEGVGGRPLAMGGAFVGLADDINALYYNPAGLTEIHYRVETYMYSQKLEVLKYHYVGIAQQNMGFSFVSQNTDKELGGKNIGKQELGMNESILGISYGGKIIETIPELSLGGSLKILSLNSPTKSGSGFSLDLGVLYKHPLYENISVGVAIRNINGEVLDEEIEEIFCVGAAYKLDNPKMILVGDLMSKKDYAKIDKTKYGYRLGVEYLPTSLLAVRLGLANGNVSGGIGLTQGKWQLDYAFGSIDALKDFNNHYISVSLKF